jgi:hypothetical protein
LLATSLLTTKHDAPVLHTQTMIAVDALQSFGFVVRET